MIHHYVIEQEIPDKDVVSKYTKFTLESLKMLVAGLRVTCEDFTLYYNKTCYIGYSINKTLVKYIQNSEICTYAQCN